MQCVSGSFGDLVRPRILDELTHALQPRELVLQRWMVVGVGHPFGAVADLGAQPVRRTWRILVL